MKLEINTTILNKELISLEENINKFIDSNNDIYNELSKINDYWQGIDAEYFINIINKDKSNCLLVLDNLYKISNLYKEINYLYDNIDKKIIYDNTYNNTIMNNINNSIEILNKTNNNIDNIVLPYNSNYKNMIINTNNNIKNIKEDLIKYQDSINNMISKLEENESEILKKISNINMNITNE